MGNVIRRSKRADTDEFGRFEEWHYDGLNRPLRHVEVVRYDANAENDLPENIVREDSARIYDYQGLTVVYSDRNQQQVTTTRQFGADPKTTEQTYHPVLGSFTAETSFNSDGTPRRLTQTTKHPTADEDRTPKTTSVVKLAYDAFGRTIRDFQSAELSDVQRESLDGSLLPNIENAGLANLPDGIRLARHRRTRQVGAQDR